MEAIKITVTGAQAVLEAAPVITSGMVGVPVEVTFDRDWEGLRKTLVYKAGGMIRDQLGVENAGTVPGEVLQTPYRNLQIGVYGASADGTVVIPTVWVTAGQIREGANPSGDPGTQSALPVWQQLMNRMEQLEAASDSKLLWEFAVPSISQAFPIFTGWMDDYSYEFVYSNGEERPWNPTFSLDPDHPDSTTVRKEFDKLFALLRSNCHTVMEFTIPGFMSVTAHPTLLSLNYEGNTYEKLTLISGNPTLRNTDFSQMYTMEISNLGIGTSLPLAQQAQNYGWYIRLYGQGGSNEGK